MWTDTKLKFLVFIKEGGRLEHLEERPLIYILSDISEYSECRLVASRTFEETTLPNPQE